MSSGSSSRITSAWRVQCAAPLDYYIRLMDTNSFISVKVSSKSDFSFLSYAIRKTVAETRQMMVFHHPLHISLTVLQKARLASCMLERSRLCRQIQLDSHQLPHHETPEPNRQLLPNRRCQLTHRLPVSRLPTLLDRPLLRDEAQQHIPLLGKVSKRAQSKLFHSSIRPQSSFKWPHFRRGRRGGTRPEDTDSPRYRYRLRISSGDPVSSSG